MKSLHYIRGGQAGWRRAGTVALALGLSIPAVLSAPTLSLTESQRKNLSSLVQTNPAAARQFRNIQRKADAAVNDPGHPIAIIQSSGLLQSDPRKRDSAASLEDMKKLHALGYAGAFSTNAAYHAAARRIILRWAEVNQPSGQPIDETKLEPLLVAYDLARPVFSPDERRQVDGWLRRLADAEIQGVRAKSATATNNWQSHRLKIIGMVGFLLDDSRLIDHAVRGFKQQVADNLRPDGSSFDFYQRDSLHYHCYTLEPLLTLASAARQNGIDLYSHRAPNDACLSNSVRFLLPYCEGVKTHEEFVHTRVRFDRARAEAGEKAYAPGQPFDPREARAVFDLAAFLDDSFKSTALRLHGGGGVDSVEFPNWQSVLNKVRK